MDMNYHFLCFRWHTPDIAHATTRVWQKSTNALAPLVSLLLAADVKLKQNESVD
jgi:hypothetical protein